MVRKVLLLVLSSVLLTGLAVQTAQAQQFPTKSIEILSPYSPGAASDVAMRMAAEGASKYLGQRVFVTHKPGGTGSVAAAEVLSSKPDGYKLLNVSNIYVGLITKTQKIPFDPNNLVPIAGIVELKLGIVVRGDSRFKTLADMIEYARKNPDKLTWAHGGRGASTYICALLIFKKAGVKTIDVPHKSGGDLLSALLGGHVDAILPGFGTVKDHVTSGQVRPLVFFSDRRFSDTPDVPSAAELGYPEASKLRTLFGVYAHKDTPEPIRRTLTEAFRKAMEDPQVKNAIAKLGDEPLFANPEAMKEHVRNAEEFGVPVLKDLGLYVGK
jgi:tripartite-type tricarboxylate transporter receptor subunit TctC